MNEGHNSFTFLWRCTHVHAGVYISTHRNTPREGGEARAVSRTASGQVPLSSLLPKFNDLFKAWFFETPFFNPTIEITSLKFWHPKKGRVGNRGRFQRKDKVQAEGTHALFLISRSFGFIANIFRGYYKKQEKSTFSSGKRNRANNPRQSEFPFRTKIPGVSPHRNKQWINIIDKYFYGNTAYLALMKPSILHPNNKDVFQRKIF